MKIFWLVNIIMPELAEHLGKHPSVYGGWLSGALNTVRDNGFQLTICTTSESAAHTEKYTVNGVNYYIAKRASVLEMENSFKAILNAEKPDVIHIYGTEFEHSWAMAKCADPEKTLVSIQGLISFISKHVFNGMPDSVTADNILHKALRKAHKGGSSIELQKQSYQLRSDAEINTLKHVSYVNGGTHWGDSCARLLHPDVKLLHCGLILRDVFYGDEKWDIQNIERHSIFTFYSYPVKGFHMFLEALRYVVEQYPDTMAYVAGNKCAYRKYTGLRKEIMDKAPDYDWYIQSLIEKYNLKKNIKFMGYVNAEQVKARELKSNVFVSASSIENHSTALGEAMITGLPSISSCVGGMQEMIDHGDDGFLYPFNEPYMLASYIMKIFEDDSLAEKLSRNGRKHAERSFSKELNSAELLAMYRIIAERE